MKRMQNMCTINMIHRLPFQIGSDPRRTTLMEKILEIFKQVKVNIPLLEAFEHVPSYAKFLKDLCTKK